MIDYPKLAEQEADTRRPGNREQRIAYVVTRFPKLSETFVAREVLALQQHGAVVECFSIHRPLPEPLPADMQELAAATTHLWPPQPLALLAAIAGFLTRTPARFLQTLALFWRQAPATFAGRKRFLLHFFEGVYLAHLCRQRGVRYLHAHFANGPSSVAMAASALSGIPFGFTSHAQDIYSDPLMLDLKIAAAALPLTISEYNRKHMLANYEVAYPAKLRVQRVAVDVTQFTPATVAMPSLRPPLVVAIGRLVAKKGFIHLVRACSRLAQSGVNFRCWIVGEGPERAALQAEIAALGLQSRIRLLGAQPNVRKFLERAEVFVMPCVQEAGGDRDGIPTTLMEAMAMRVPVISTEISGIPELVQHETTGLLAPPEDPEALARAMARLLADEALRARLAAAGRRYIEQCHNLEINSRRLWQWIQLRMLNAEAEEGSRGPHHPAGAVSTTARPDRRRARLFADQFQIMFA